MDQIKDFLFANQDKKYAAFLNKLTPTIDQGTIVGIRTPELRQFAKELSKQGDIDVFLKTLPHDYFEENQLHAFIISLMKDYDEVVAYIDAFLPYVDNWATCDQMSPRIFKKHHDRLIIDINRWIQSDEVYTIRFGVEMLMTHFLDADFKEEYLELVSGIQNDDYYVRMVIAWYFSFALIKQYDATIEYFIHPRLDRWTHNKALQKSVESRRISKETKDYLRTLKIK